MVHRSHGVIGWGAHREAVGALERQLADIPPGDPVRLAKPTSNLFRPRASTGRPGLDVGDLGGVIDIDPIERVAQVQGMCTYEHLVDVTLSYDLMPTVVPQLRTITLGGAVTGLGIESSSFRDGLPHEAVRELDVLTGTGEVLTCSDIERADLFRAFPNSYGSLGYATRVEIDLVPVQPFVRLRHVRFGSVEELLTGLSDVLARGEYDGAAVDFVDGVVFSEREAYLVLARWSEHAPYVSDYTGQHIYYRSIAARREDYLTVRDYLWRWDTDWFWCSRALFVQKPLVRRIVPNRYLRSDTYGKVIRLENRHGWWAALERRRGRPDRERVVQDVEIPLDRTQEFLEWFLREVPIEPIWLCPLIVRDATHGTQPWPLYPLQVGETYVNVGFWATVPIEGGDGDEGTVNRRIEHEVARLGGHKSLYSDAYYDEETFWRLYGGDAYAPVKKKYDPAGRLPDLYAKAVGRR